MTPVSPTTSRSPSLYAAGLYICACVWVYDHEEGRVAMETYRVTVGPPGVSSTPPALNIEDDQPCYFRQFNAIPIHCQGDVAV